MKFHIFTSPNSFLLVESSVRKLLVENCSGGKEMRKVVRSKVKIVVLVESFGRILVPVHL